MKFVLLILGFIFILFILGITLILKRIKKFMSSIFPTNAQSNPNFNNSNFNNFGFQNYSHDSQPTGNSYSKYNSNDEVVYKKDDIIVMKGNNNRK